MLGRQIGSYEVVSKLGEGGMGVVYLARHGTLGRLAAVKVLLPEFSNNREIVARFFNEARAATAIRHPGIIEVYDFGFLEEQQAYIIMEYLEGESLGTRLRRGPLAISAALATTRGIARALQAAHEKAIVHRDLKPDNIFLVPDDDARSGERVKLLDFGIAKLTPNANEPGQTRTGMVIGTPTYMAPEQCRGDTVDLRADLYALGCVIYQMLCGQPPFVANASADVLAHHLYFEPQRVSALRPDVPPAVEQLVMALLAKDPAARPASANVVVQVVDSMMSGVGVVTAPEVAARPARPPSSAAPAVPTTLSGAASSVAVHPRRSRRPLVIGLSALVAALVVVAVIAAQGSSPPAGTAVAAAPDAPAKVASAEPPPERAPSPPPPSPPPPPPPPSDASGSAAPAVKSGETSGSAAPASKSAGDSALPAPRPTAPPRPAKKDDRTRKQRAATTPPPAPPRPPEEPAKKPECAAASFRPILTDPSPQEAAVQAALSRLRGCKASLGADAFTELQRLLVDKL